MAKIYGYIRCSTDETRQDITRQERELKELGVKPKDIYKEYQSGTKVDRVELQKLLDIVQEGDTIVSTEVSRITRSTKQLCDIIELAKERKLKLVLGNFVVDCTKELDPMTEGMLKMMGVFSEMERNMISQRVKSGLVNAKVKGQSLGRPKTTTETIPKKFIEHYELYKQKKLNVTDMGRLLGMSRTTIYKYMKMIKEQEGQE